MSRQRRSNVHRVWQIPIILLVCALAACSGDDDTATPATQPTPTTASTTTTTEDPAAADHQLIVGLYRSMSDAWYDGPRAGIEAMVNAQYPGTGYTVDQCVANLFPQGAPDGVALETIVDQGSIQPDPDWTVPGGPLDGTKPEGRTYILSVHGTVTADDAAPQESTSEVHATILDGTAYIFPDCD